MSKLIDFIKNTKTEFVHWIEKEKPIAATLLHEAATISTQVIAFAASPQGRTVEQFIESLIPGGSVLVPEIVEVITKFSNSMIAINNHPEGLKGLGQRLGAEVLRILHGGKLPTGIDGYIAEFQKLFIDNSPTGTTTNS